MPKRKNADRIHMDACEILNAKYWMRMRMNASECMNANKRVNAQWIRRRMYANERRMNENACCMMPTIPESFNKPVVISLGQTTRFWPTPIYFLLHHELLWGVRGTKPQIFTFKVSFLVSFRFSFCFVSRFVSFLVSLQVAFQILANSTTAKSTPQQTRLRPPH